MEATNKENKEAVQNWYKLLVRPQAENAVYVLDTRFQEKRQSPGKVTEIDYDKPTVSGEIGQTKIVLPS